jgi:hypothetical protein
VLVSLNFLVYTICLLGTWLGGIVTAAVFGSLLRVQFLVLVAQPSDGGGIKGALRRVLRDAVLRKSGPYIKWTTGWWATRNTNIGKGSVRQRYAHFC